MTTLKLNPAILAGLLPEHPEWIPILTLDGDFMLATTAYSEQATDAQEVCRWTSTASYPFMLRAAKETIEIHSDVEFAAALWSLDCCGDFTVIHEYNKKMRAEA